MYYNNKNWNLVHYIKHQNIENRNSNQASQQYISCNVTIILDIILCSLYKPIFHKQLDSFTQPYCIIKII